MLTTKIKAYKHAVRRACCNGKCKLQIDVEGEYTILEGEKMVTRDKVCDCIIFQNDGTIVMVELKSKSLHASSIVAQLTNGGNTAVKIAAEAGIDEPSLYFILMAKSFSNYSAASILNQKKVMVGNKPYPIRRSECNKTMSGILNKHSQRAG